MFAKDAFCRSSQKAGRSLTKVKSQTPSACYAASLTQLAIRLDTVNTRS